MESSRLRLALVSGLVVAAVFAAFWPGLSGEFLTWDDNPTIVENEYFRGLDAEHLKWMFTTFRMGHWQPLAWVTFALNYKVSELSPYGYHLTNLALHAANSVLFFFLNAISILLILVLFFLLARNGIKLFFERKRGILGSHLNWKFVGAPALATEPKALPLKSVYVVAPELSVIWTCER